MGRSRDQTDVTVLLSSIQMVSLDGAQSGKFTLGTTKCWKMLIKLTGEIENWREGREGGKGERRERGERAERGGGGRRGRGRGRREEEG